jgi:hypothetical protein
MGRFGAGRLPVHGVIHTPSWRGVLKSAMLNSVMRKLLRALELALLAVIGAVQWVIDWVERQSTAMKLGVGMLSGVAATMAVAAIYAWLR